MFVHNVPERGIEEEGEGNSVAGLGVKHNLRELDFGWDVTSPVDLSRSVHATPLSNAKFFRGHLVISTSLVEDFKVVFSNFSLSYGAPGVSGRILDQNRMEGLKKASYPPFPAAICDCVTCCSAFSLPFHTFFRLRCHFYVIFF